MAILADRRVNHAPGELLRQVLGGLETRRQDADILAVR